MNKNHNSQDIAWVEIKIPFNIKWLKKFIKDLERLYKINSLMEFKHWQKTAKNTYTIKGKNLSNNQIFSNSITIEKKNNKTIINYKSGIKLITIIEVKAVDEDNSILKIVDDYGKLANSKKQQRLNEVDKSLNAWANDIFKYCYAWKRYAKIPLWQWYMTKVWQPMKPSSRRITKMIIIVTVLEFIVFLFVFTIFWLENFN